MGDILKWITELSPEKALRMFLVLLVFVEGYAFYKLYEGSRDCDGDLKVLTSEFSQSKENSNREKMLLIRDGISKVEECIKDKEVLYNDLLRQRDEVREQGARLNQLNEILKKRK